jgi:hypothetical protein
VLDVNGFLGMVAKNYSSVDNERDLIEAFQVRPAPLSRGGSLFFLLVRAVAESGLVTTVRGFPGL